MHSPPFFNLSEEYVYLFDQGFASLCLFVCPQTKQGHLYLLFSPAPLRPCFSIVLVCLSTDGTGSPVPFAPSGSLRYSFSVLVCLSADWTGSPVPSPQSLFLIYSVVHFLTFLSVYLSADWTGALRPLFCWLLFS